MAVRNTGARDVFIQVIFHLQGADVNIKDTENEATPLHVACSQGYPTAVKILVDAGDT